MFYVVCGWDALLEAVERVRMSANLTATMVYHDDGTFTRSRSVRPVIPRTPWPPPTIPCTQSTAKSCYRFVGQANSDHRRVRGQHRDRLWDENLREGQIEWMSAMANRLPMTVVARLLGLPDDDVDQLIRLAYAATTLLDGIVTPDNSKPREWRVDRTSGDCSTFQEGKCQC